MSYDKEYLIRIQPQRLLTLDIQVGFEQAYELMDKLKDLGFTFITIRPDKPKRHTYSFPILLSKYERKPSKFNPEIPEWYRGITLRTKLISITLSPLLYIIGGTLVVRIPHLLEGLTATRGVVSVIYGLTAFVLFDGGLYFLFGISFIVLLAKRISKYTSQSHSRDL